MHSDRVWCVPAPPVIPHSGRVHLREFSFRQLFLLILLFQKILAAIIFGFGLLLTIALIKCWADDCDAVLGRSKGCAVFVLLGAFVFCWYFLDMKSELKTLCNQMMEERKEKNMIVDI